MRRRFFTFCSFMLLVFGLFGQGARMASRFASSPLSTPPQQSAEIAKIQAYHDEIDVYARQHPTAVRYFSSENTDEATSKWKEYQTKKTLPDGQTHASVWMKGGQVVAAIISNKGEHGWDTDGSYFRADGTLAYREVRTYSIGYLPPYRLTKEFFSPAGEMLKTTTKCTVSDTDTKDIPCEEPNTEDWVKQLNDSLFKKNTDLPFYSLLARGH